MEGPKEQLIKLLKSNKDQLGEDYDELISIAEDENTLAADLRSIAIKARKLLATGA